MADARQDLSNHARLVPGYHFVTGPLVLVYVVWSAWRAATIRDAASVHALVGALGLFGVYAFTRLFPLKAQDRVIRLEERLRLQQLLPADLAARIPELRPSWLIALRFASDAELPELVRWTLETRPATQKEIKQRIRDWRADHFRV